MNPLSLAQALQPVNWPLFVLVSARVAGVMLTAPVWSMTTIPGTVRGAIAVVITLALLPAVPNVPVAVDGMSVLVPLVTELLLGIAIGMTASVFLAGVAVAAEVVSLQMGLSLGSALAGMAEIGTPGGGQLEGQFSLAVYVAVGGHLALLGAVARSFTVIAPGAPLAMTSGGNALLTLGGTVFSTGIHVAAPMMVALLITNLGLAVLNRAVPQLNTMMVAVPITVAVGLIALGTALPYSLNVVGGWASHIGESADAVVRAFTPTPAVP